MSAKRFGGAHSPGGPPAGEQPKFRDRKAASVDIRALTMFVLPTPLLFAALGHLGGDVAKAMVALGGYAALMLGAWLLREGQRAEDAFNARQIAKPPAFPRKICAAVLTGAGVAVAVLLARGMGDFLSAGLSAILATGAHLAAFGLDPMRSKGIDGAPASDQVIEALDRAETRVSEVQKMISTLRDREISGRVDGLMARVREMLRLIEQDPRDLSRARRYLTVYLKGAEDATRKYVQNHARLDDPKLRTDYLDMIGELEGSFGRGRDMLLQDDRMDLEVEIEVLRERLGQEAP